MSMPANSVLIPEVREILEHLGEAMFPLASWLAEPAKYQPPQSDLPWRDEGRRLSPKAIGALDFLESLLGDNQREIALLARWSELEANPLKFSPFEKPADWRRARGLDVAAAFGVAKSGNVPLEGEGR